MFWKIAKVFILFLFFDILFKNSLIYEENKQW